MESSISSRAFEQMRMQQMERGYILKGNQILKPGLGAGGEGDDKVAAALFAGEMSNLPTLGANEVRLFISSTFSDFKAERNYLVEHAFPSLRQFCAERGLDFRVCDMRWGVTDASVNEHLVERLCLREIDQCRRNSTGPFFIALLGDRYGYQPVPPSWEGAEFNLVNQYALRYAAKTAAVLNEWYWEDMNSVPPVRLLQPIRWKFPYYGDYLDERKRREAGNQWWEVEEGIRNTIRRSTHKLVEKGMMDPSRRQIFQRGVTETEIRYALCLPENHGGPRSENENSEATGEETTTASKEEIDMRALVAARSLVYSRRLMGLSENLKHENAVKYTDIVLRDDVETQVEENQEFLTEIKALVKATGVRFRDFNIPWTEEGVTPNNESHRRYLEQLSQAIVSDLRRSIQQRLASDQLGATWRTPLTEEIASHLHFAVEKCSLFVGREEEIETVRKLWLDDNCDAPIVLHAPSGGGKTALVAKITEMAKTKWFADKQCVSIVRFLGTSGQSWSIYQMLRSVCQQICHAFKITFEERKVQSMREVRSYFPLLLRTVSVKVGRLRPLVIFFDSLDQLSANDNAHSCTWIPSQLPPGVYLLLSTLPTHFGILNRLKSRFPAKNFVEVQKLSTDTVETIVKSYQKAKSRKLTIPQENMVLETVQKEPSPLFLKLCMDQAFSWKSFTPIEECSLSHDIRGAIESLFERLEVRYGSLLIRSALGYLTAGYNGLTELELEDVLTCQDVVLNEVYRYHDPPIKGVIRLPSLLWSRVRYDLQDYLCERQMDTKLVLTWYHRQFYEVAFNRYLGVEERRIELHSHLAYYFSQERPLKRTIVLSNVKRTLEVKDADRQISYSVLSVRNPRQLHCIPYHLLESRDTNAFLQRCVIRYNFVDNFIRAFGAQEYLGLIRRAIQVLPRETDHGVLPIFLNCLTFLQRFLYKDLNKLPLQLIGQLKNVNVESPQASRVFESICSQCESTIIERSRKNNQTCLIPTYNCFPSCLGKLKWYQERVEKIHFQPWDDDFMLIHCRDVDSRHQVCLLNTEDMSVVVKITAEKRPILMRLSPDRNLIFFNDERHIHIYDAENGKHLGTDGLFINNKVMLNACLAIAQDSSWVGVAAQERIALLANRGPQLEKDDMLVHKRLFIVAKMTIIDLLFICSSSESSTPTLLVSLHFATAPNCTRRYTLKCFRFLDKAETWSTELPTVAPGSSTSSSDGSLLLPHPSSPIHIFVITSDAHIFLISASDGSIVTHLRPPSPFGMFTTAQLLSVSFSPSQRTFTTCLQTKGPEKKVYIRTVDADVKLLAEFQGLELDGFSGEQVSVAFTVGGEKTRWIIGGNQGRICLTAGRTVNQQMTGHQDKITSVSLISDPTHGSLITFSESERSLKLWDVNDWIQEEEKTPGMTPSSGPPRPDILHGQRPIIACALCVDPSRLIIVSEDGLTYWNVADGRLESLCPVTGKRSFDWKAVERVESFSADQYVLIQDSNSSRIFIVDVNGEGRVLNHIRDVRQWKRAKDHPEHLVMVTQEAKQSYMGLQVKRIPNLTPVVGKRFLPPVEISGTTVGRLQRVEWFHSDSWDFGLLSWQIGGRGKVKNVAWAINLSEGGSTSHLVPCTMPENTKATSRPTVTSKVSRDSLHSVNAFIGPTEPDVPRLLVGSDGGDLPMWDLMTGSCHMQKVCYFHSWFKHSVVINLQVNQKKKTADGQFTKYPITVLEASSDCSLVISGCAGGRIMMWRWLKILALGGAEPTCNPREFRFELGHPGAHRESVTCLKLSEDLSLLISGGTDKQLCLFGLSELAPGVLLKRIYIHMTPYSITFDASQNLITGKAEEMGEERPFAFHVVRPDADFSVNRRSVDRS